MRGVSAVGASLVTLPEVDGSAADAAKTPMTKATTNVYSFFISLREFKRIVRAKVVRPLTQSKLFDTKLANDINKMSSAIEI